MPARPDWKRIQEITLRNTPYLIEHLQIAAEDESIIDMYAILEDLCSHVGGFLSEMYDTRTAEKVWKAAQEIAWSPKNPNPRL